MPGKHYEDVRQLQENNGECQAINYQKINKQCREDTMLHRKNVKTQQDELSLNQKITHASRDTWKVQGLPITHFVRWEHVLARPVPKPWLSPPRNYISNVFCMVNSSKQVRGHIEMGRNLEHPHLQTPWWWYVLDEEQQSLCQFGVLKWL